MGRHSAPARRSLPILVLAPLLAVGGASAAAAALDNSKNPGSACDKPEHVSVAAPVEIAPVVRKLVAPLKDRAGVCTAFDVTDRDAQSAGRDIAVNAPGTPQVWITDSPLIVERVNKTRKSNHLTPSASVATSPVTFGIPGAIVQGQALTADAKSLRAAFAAQGGRVDLAQVLASQGGRLPLRVADPETSTATLVGATAALAATGDDDTASLGLARTMVGASHTWSTDAELQLLAARRDKNAVIWPASEQQLYAINRQFPEAGMAGAPFTQGNPQLDYRVVPTATTSEAAAKALTSALTGAAGVQELRDAGFRVGGKGGTKTQVAGMSGASVKPFPLTLDEVESTVRVTDTVGLDINLLTVMDVTGSMRAEAVDGRNRIQMATAAVSKAVALLPPSTRFGLWEFATGINGSKNPKPYREVLPVAALATKRGGATQSDAAQAALSEMPKHIAGGTPLYGTILAAYKAAQSHYDPTTTNAMVLVTDGRNEDSAGPDLTELLSELKDASDPKKPIKVILVGIGEEADMPTLRQIAKATGGDAYNASDPATISDVVFDAIAQRVTAATQL